MHVYYTCIYSSMFNRYIPVYTYMCIHYIKACSLVSHVLIDRATADKH